VTLQLNKIVIGLTDMTNMKNLYDKNYLNLIIGTLTVDLDHLQNWSVYNDDQASEEEIALTKIIASLVKKLKEAE